MADDVDIANEGYAVLLAHRIQADAKEIPPGVPGDCDLCGEYSSRLIGGACAPCRDKYDLP